MWLSLFFIFSGSVLLYIGAELLVRAAIVLSRHFHISPLIIGLTITAFATSFPEALTTIIGQIRGKTGDIALGNIIGSNSANIGFVLAISLFITPCKINPTIRWQKMPVMLFSSLLVFCLMLKETITRFDGVILLTALALYMILQYRLAPKKEVQAELALHNNHSPPSTFKIYRQFFFLGKAVL